MHDVNANISGYPLAYFITFRCYGTWLHGDERGSIDRHQNLYGTPRIPARPSWHDYASRRSARGAVRLNAARRAVVDVSVRQTCDLRGWNLAALNVRTNHVHAVVAAMCPPGAVMTAFKANATRGMREAGCWTSDESPWARGGSKRYLWTQRQVEMAVDYVLNGQGDALPEF